ncbi:solute symporter family protein [Streptomyces milbemycinicus]|uniref:solute symporter family protein n=1 Tax=Streptomyces milbemycinicus TaxID=476552 RepID=UPI0033E8C08C
MSHRALSIALFAAFVVATVAISYVAGRRTRSASDFYAAGRRIRGWQNGIAVAGDYLSGATLLGVTGLIALYGFDGAVYLVGFLVAFLVVLVLIAELLRNTGTYTMADTLAFRLRPRPVRAVSAVSTMVINLFYLTSQMVGAGGLIGLLLGLHGTVAGGIAIGSVGVLMILYVTVGGMIGTTWVQIIKAVLLLAATALLTLLVLARFDFSVGHLLESAAQASGDADRYLGSGSYFTNKLDLVSLSLALVLGTAGLPHVLMRFFTVRDARSARASSNWTIGIVGVFYLGLIVLGLGATALVGPAAIKKADSNMATPLLARFLGGGESSMGGALLMAVIAAVAFATILAVVAGLTLTASASFAHDFYAGVLRHGAPDERREVAVARRTAIVLGVVAVALAIGLQKVNLAFLVGVVFALAASANLPVLVLSLYWRRFNTAGAVTGTLVGLVSSVVLVAVSPTVIGPSGLCLHHVTPYFPLSNPGIVSIPLAFLSAIVATLLTGREEQSPGFDELRLRALTGYETAERGRP